MSANLPPLPRGRRMGSGVINGKLIELFMHDDAAMLAYATAALSAQATEVEALRAALAELVRTRELLRDCHSSQGAIPLGELAALLNAAWDAARAALKERAPNAGAKLETTAPAQN